MLLVANSSWNLFHFRRPLLEGLHRSGARILLAAAGSDPGGWPVPVHYHRIDGLDGGLLTSPGTLRRLRRLLRRTRPRLVLSFTIKPNLLLGVACRWMRIPQLATLTGLGYAHLSGAWLRWSSLLLYRACLSKATVICHNADDARTLQRWRTNGASAPRVIAGSGVDTERFTATPLPPRGSTLQLLFIGRLLHDKGIAELVRAVDKLRHTGASLHLHVVGALYPDNPAALTTEEWDRLRASPAVTWHGRAADVRPYLRACHVFALPSYREGLPMSSLEAMATARPLLTTDVPGCRETVVPGRNGWLVPARSTVALETALRTVLVTDFDQLAAYGRYSRQLVLERFSAERIVAAYAALWTPLLRRP